MLRLHNFFSGQYSRRPQTRNFGQQNQEGEIQIVRNTIHGESYGARTLSSVSLFDFHGFSGVYRGKMRCFTFFAVRVSNIHNYIDPCFFAPRGLVIFESQLRPCCTWQVFPFFPQFLVLPLQFAS